MSTKQVLLVDPDPDHTWKLCEALSSVGHTVVDTPNPHYAKQFLGERRFDAALLDISTTRIRDADLLDTLKQDWTNPTIIVMADFKTRSVEKDLFRRGAHYFVLKPVDTDSLLDLISGQST